MPQSIFRVAVTHLQIFIKCYIAQLLTLIHGTELETLAMFDIDAYTLRKAKLSLRSNAQIVIDRKDQAFREIERQVQERDAKTAKLRALRMANAVQITPAVGLLEAGASSGKATVLAGRRAPRKLPLAPGIR
jgi:hypothetical protein